MRISITTRAFVALCLAPLILAAPPGRARAAETVAAHQTIGDLSPFRAIAADTLAIASTGDLTRARTRIKALEASWDAAEASLRPRDPEQWRLIDKAIDTALLQLRADRPQQPAAKDALQYLLTVMDRSKQGAKPADSVFAETASLSVIDIIAAVEKLQAGATVLDVSFEPKDGKPTYAVRTYTKGKVWDGVLDAASGVIIVPGTVVDESMLDDEDKAELAALKRAQITMRQAIESAERSAAGTALSAGLEQVDGRIVWEILVQSASQSRQFHIDPVTGKVL